MSPPLRAGSNDRATRGHVSTKCPGAKRVRQDKNPGAVAPNLLPTPVAPGQAPNSIYPPLQPARYRAPPHTIQGVTASPCGAAVRDR
ncbi:hypothetical protein NDU88_010579 [Pleurodeles waltl]|uniref:Uncharacterized protein n=1 Tax=Pleurodeles waltl TaxID=8319 RepID=A0AAV7S1N9_PLEWA|nr:hypothetical protein NDU88_010579 [Pleurodeles waltl]